MVNQNPDQGFSFKDIFPNVPEQFRIPAERQFNLRTQPTPRRGVSVATDDFTGGGGAISSAEVQPGESATDAATRLITQNRQRITDSRAAPTGPAPTTGRTSQPSTFRIAFPGAGSPFGFDPGAVPGGDAVSFLEEAGFPVPESFRNLREGQFLRRPDVGSAARQLGNVGIPSPQSLRRLGLGVTGPEGGLTTGIEQLISLFEVLLGIPFQDILSASGAPFEGLRTARPGRTRRLR